MAYTTDKTSFFDFRKFRKAILNEFIDSEDRNCTAIFDKHFALVVEKYDIEVILNRYCTKQEIISANCRYGSEYLEKQLNIVLFEKIMDAIVKYSRKWCPLKRT
jgi:hypothetical protein